MIKGKGATRIASKKQSIRFAALLPWFKKGVTATVVLTVLVATLLLGLQWVNKDVEQLTVRAPLVHVTEQHIRERLQSQFPASFFYLDVEEVRAQLLSMPMVRQASVEKVWPDTLVIELQEEVPVARWNDSAMLSHAGEILPMDAQQLSRQLVLPDLKGQPEKRQMVMRHFHLFTQWAKAYSLNWMGVQHSLAGWHLTEKNGLEIWLNAEDAMSGLKRLGGVLQKLNLDNVESIDLRYEQGFAVAWRPLMDQAEDKEKKA